MHHITPERSGPTGVLLTNVGSPDAPSAAAVRRYLDEFLADPMVVDAPRATWWLIRKLIILPLRAPRSARLYRSIWTDGGSPLMVVSRRQAEALEAELGERMEYRVPLVLAMRYGRPSIHDGLQKLVQAGCRSVLVLPLFPQYSRTTVGTTVAAVKRIVEELPEPPETRMIEGYCTLGPYIRALAASIRESLLENPQPGHLVISFHGLPKRYADAGDPYPLQCEATAAAVAEELGLEPEQWTLCYQSRFGREEWLGPATDDVLRELGGRGEGPVFVVCPGFAADCLETLEEVAVGYRRIFVEAGGRAFHYVPALNDRSDHIAALADLAGTTLRTWEGTTLNHR